MGKLFTGKSSKEDLSTKKNITLNTNKEQILYKPLSDFKWKDANQAEIHQNSIRVYKEKYAF